MELFQIYDEVAYMENGMRKLPVTAVINGERTVVGEAQVDTTGDGNEFIADVVIDASKVLGKNWTKSLGPFSIGRQP
jgi:hypothetical protein